MKIKVKMLTGIAGLPNPDYDLPEHSYAPEEIVMVHPTLATAWIAGGIAQAVREKPSPAERTAEVKPSEGPTPSTPEVTAEATEPLAPRLVRPRRSSGN
jgi:hypothetical protein